MVPEHALIKSGYAPKRSLASPEDLKQYSFKKGIILIDAIEQRTQRRVAPDYQEQMCSGGSPVR